MSFGSLPLFLIFLIAFRRNIVSYQIAFHILCLFHFLSLGFLSVCILLFSLQSISTPTIEIERSILFDTNRDLWCIASLTFSEERKKSLFPYTTTFYKVCPRNAIVFRFHIWTPTRIVKIKSDWLRNSIVLLGKQSLSLSISSTAYFPIAWRLGSNRLALNG